MSVGLGLNLGLGISMPPGPVVIDSLVVNSSFSASAAPALGGSSTIGSSFTTTANGRLWQPDDRSDCAAYVDLSNVASVTVSGSLITKVANLAVGGATAGTSLDLTASGSARPTYDGSTKATFDGVATILASAAYTLNQPSTIVVAYRLLTGVASNAGIIDARTGGQRMIFDSGTTNHTLACYAAGAATLQQATNSYADNVAGAAGASFDGTNGSSTIFRVLGLTDVGPGTNVGSSTASGWVLGARGGVAGAGSSFCKCDIYRAAIFTSALSAANLAIAVAWANNHP